jgi:hypothetical protein
MEEDNGDDGSGLGISPTNFLSGSNNISQSSGATAIDQVNNGDGTVTTYYSDGSQKTTTPASGIVSSSTPDIASLIKNFTSSGAGQLASMAGIGSLLSSALGGGSQTYAGYQGKIPKFTAQRQQYGLPVAQTGVYTPNLPANATAAQKASAINPQQLTSYLNTGHLNDSQIANTMSRYGITPENLVPLTGLDTKTIQDRYNTAMGPNAQLAGHYRPGQGGITYFSPMQYNIPSAPAATPATTAPAATGINDPSISGASGGLMESYAAGGGIGSLGTYSDGGRLLKGPGDGVSDSIPAQIGQHQPARLADGEFVIPARIVSEIGNGSTDAGARKLYAMMERIQKDRKKTIKNVAANTKAEKHLPA